MSDVFPEIVYARVIVPNETVISHDAISEDNDDAIYSDYARAVIVDDNVISRRRVRHQSLRQRRYLRRCRWSSWLPHQ